MTAPNFKPGLAQPVYCRMSNAGNLRHGWGFIAYGFQKLFKQVCACLDFADYTCWCIADPAGKPQLCGNAVGKWTKTNALNRATNFNIPALGGMKYCFVG